MDHDGLDQYASPELNKFNAVSALWLNDPEIPVQTTLIRPFARACLATLALGITPALGLAAPVGDFTIETRDAITLQAQPFPLSEVRLLDGPFKHAQDLDAQYLLSLDVDRLLYSFRVNAGLPSTAKPYGGWEEPKSEVRGPFRRPLSLRLRPDVCQHWRRAAQAEGRGGRRGARGLPGEVPQRLPERLSGGVH